MSLYSSDEEQDAFIFALTSPILLWIESQHTEDKIKTVNTI